MKCTVRIKIPFETELEGHVTIAQGKWGVIFAHGELSTIDDGILEALPRKLKQKNISSATFNFPFRMKQNKKADDLYTLDQAYIAAFTKISTDYPDIRWAVGGHGIGGLTAIRISGIIYSEFGIPPVICISYPMYPNNRPELVDTMVLGALMGDALFCQGNKSRRGTYDRLRNQIEMMARHAKISMIRGANHFMEVEGKKISTVAYWIANDVSRFFNEIY